MHYAAGGPAADAATATRWLEHVLTAITPTQTFRTFIAHFVVFTRIGRNALYRSAKKCKLIN